MNSLLTYISQKQSLAHLQELSETRAISAWIGQSQHLDVGMRNLEVVQIAEIAERIWNTGKSIEEAMSLEIATNVQEQANTQLWLQDRVQEKEE